ncbi:hypothetical protein [Acinetobacter sp. CFCC 10889]|uniref:hypothetical protein n=1 Tax=Acinetobacter sp. CFCC 10889 TaxID=1775557 RepID=UPI000DD07C93|nr:hypothetical protein [Acinetobacter sp. CFCC 10889]
MNIIKPISIISFSTLISACATHALFGNSTTETNTKTSIALQDQIVAIGHTSKPVKGFENALVLVGKQHSFFVQPNNDANNPSYLFQRIFTEIDLKSVYLAPSLGHNTTTQINTHQNNHIILELNEKIQNNRSVPYDASLYFIKASKDVSKNEKNQLLSLGFQCQTALEDYPQQTVCSREINTEITLASKVQNANSLPYKLKQPIDIQYKVTSTSKDYSRQFFKVLTPVTVAFDIVTFPIQGGIFLIGAMLGSPGGL